MEVTVNTAQIQVIGSFFAVAVESFTILFYVAMIAKFREFRVVYDNLLECFFLYI